MWYKCVPNCGACCFFKKGDTGPAIEAGKIKKIEKVFGPRKEFADKVGRKWFLKTNEDYDPKKVGPRSKLGGGTHVGECPCIFLDTSNGHSCKIVRDVGKKFQPSTCNEWHCKTIGRKAQTLQEQGDLDIGNDFKEKTLDEIIKFLEKQ